MVQVEFETLPQSVSSCYYYPQSHMHLQSVLGKKSSVCGPRPLLGKEKWFLITTSWLPCLHLSSPQYPEFLQGRGWIRHREIRRWQYEGAKILALHICLRASLSSFWQSYPSASKILNSVIMKAMMKSLLGWQLLPLLHLWNQQGSSNKLPCVWLCYYWAQCS